MANVLLWPPVVAWSAYFDEGFGMAVLLPRRLLVVGVEDAGALDVVDLVTGTPIHSIGSAGSGAGQFDFEGGGGLCATPCDDTVLVADTNNRRVIEVHVDSGAFLRVFGDNETAMRPRAVDCNAGIVAVSEGDDSGGRVSMYAWATAALVARLSHADVAHGRFTGLHGIRVLQDGTGVIVTEYDDARLTVVGVDGGVRRSWTPQLRCPMDVVEVSVAGAASFVVAGFNHRLTLVSGSGEFVEQLGADDVVAARRDKGGET